LAVLSRGYPPCETALCRMLCKRTLKCKYCSISSLASRFAHIGGRAELHWVDDKLEGVDASLHGIPVYLTHFLTSFLRQPGPAYSYKQGATHQYQPLCLEPQHVRSSHASKVTMPLRPTSHYTQLDLYGPHSQHTSVPHNSSCLLPPEHSSAMLVTAALGQGWGCGAVAAPTTTLLSTPAKTLLQRLATGTGGTRVKAAVQCLSGTGGTLP
jgi:hypothetical protein